MSRKLVSIQRVESLHPIEAADNILKARVMGWDVVVKRDEFSPGDSCVFFEIDSVLPEGAPWAEFLRARKFRVKTIRLRGVLSQGRALPVSILPSSLGVPAVGADVGEALAVTKFEAIQPDTKEIAGPFPAGVPKTDEIRLQSVLGVMEEMQGRDFVITTKLDGMSATFFRSPEGELFACSRNWSLLRGANHAWRFADRLGLASVELFVFNVFDTSSRRYLSHAEARSYCEAHGLRAVPVESIVRGEEAAAFEHSLERYLDLARGLYAGTNNRKEGIVVRPLEEARSPTLGGRLSFKVINNDFLLKDEE